jgi:hypothetical protein
MYWDAWGIFVGQGIPERIFVDWFILPGTGVEDTMPIRLLIKIFLQKQNNLLKVINFTRLKPQINIGNHYCPK